MRVETKNKLHLQKSFMVNKRLKRLLNYYYNFNQNTIRKIQAKKKKKNTKLTLFTLYMNLCKIGFSSIYLSKYSHKAFPPPWNFLKTTSCCCLFFKNYSHHKNKGRLFEKIVANRKRFCKSFSFTRPCIMWAFFQILNHLWPFTFKTLFNSILLNSFISGFYLSLFRVEHWLRLFFFSRNLETKSCRLQCNKRR